MSELIHFLKHLIGLCGETSHPSILITGGLFFATISLYWTRLKIYIKGLFK